MGKKPSWWGGSTDEFVDELYLKERETSKDGVGENVVEFETPEYPTNFVEIKFGKKTYHAAIVHLSNAPPVVWDSETSYPSTSLRRKLSDIKYRIFKN
jgi:hypothetical protein